MSSQPASSFKLFEGPAPSVLDVQAMLEAAWPNGMPDFRNMPDNGIVDYIDIMRPAGPTETEAHRALFKELRDLAKTRNITIV